MKKTPMGSGPQHRPIQKRVTPASRNSSGANAYDLGRGDEPQHKEPQVRVTPKSTSGDVERPVHMNVVRAKAPVSAKRPKHVSVRKALT